MITIQPHTNTQRHRYDPIFKRAQKAFSMADKLNILSFGCSTGEEVLDLNELFTDATITGCDVSHACIEAAKRKIKAPNIKFICLADTELSSISGPFDMVTAMSVLCKWPETFGTENIRHIYPFEVFDSIVSALDLLLKPGGTFLLYNANYFFEDTSAARQYRASMESEDSENGFVEKYSPAGIRLTELEIGDRHGCYRPYQELVGAAPQMKIQHVVRRHKFINPAARTYDLKTSIWIKEQRM